MRRLIINADDFGLTSGVNRGILEAQTRGIVTSTTLMANSRAFDEAVRLVGNLDAHHLSVGCHVVLVDGEPLQPADSVRSLLQPGAVNGAARFRTSLNEFAVASFRHRINPQEIEAEAGAQMARLRMAGLTPSHFDTHKHTHMFPAVLRPLLRAAQAQGIGAVRNPFGKLFPMPLHDLLRKAKLWKRFAQLNVLRNFAAGFRRQVEAHGLHTTDGSLGVLTTGVLDVKLFTQVAESIPEGTWEFVCHPGYNDAELDKVDTRLRESRVKELELLISPEAKEVLQRRGVELISYREL